MLPLLPLVIRILREPRDALLSSSKLIEGLKVTDETGTTWYTRGKYRRVVILKTDERELVYIYSIRERLVMS